MHKSINSFILLSENTLNFKEVIKEKPKEKPITTRDYYETYSGGCGNTYGGFSRSGGC